MIATQPQFDESTLTQLEFPAILSALKEHIRTPYGHDVLQSIQPSSNPETISRWLQEVEELKAILDAGETIPIGFPEDIRPLLEKIRPEDSFLESDELLRIRSYLFFLGELRAFFTHYLEHLPTLVDYIRALHPHRDLVREIDRRIAPDGEVLDTASPELREIRRNILRLEQEEKTMLQRLLRRYKEYSQDEIITLRDGRMVLAIQQQWAHKVNGIVHGTSSSGATVFIEPLETLRISNEIQNLRIEERKEIIKILRQLTGMLRQVRQDILYGTENLGVLDFIHAKAVLARELQATAPRLSTDPVVELHQARHPLLIRKIGHQNVVPLHLELGKNFVTLVITGPNAGGKTVSLKTVGLILVMVHYGIPVPVQPNSIVPVLERMMVDIGDQQSIEQDLSTFSAHIVRLKEMLANATPRSLLLIDEIGTGTDPREGSALAIAILEHLTRQRALTIATTHHGELKAFAHTAPAVENASMEFDLDTLQPTYRLRIGVPGSSYAFEIARRYGLPEEILQKARDIVGREQDVLEALVLDLQKKIQQLEKEHRELSIKLSEAEGLRQLYQRQVEALKKEKKTLKQEALREARQLVDDARKKIEHLVAEIRRTEASRSSIKQAHKELEELKRALQPEEEALPEVSDGVLRPGDTVWIESLREEGEVETPPDEKGRVRVLVGNVHLTLDARNLRKIPKSVDSGAPVSRRKGEALDTLSEQVGPELDVRGLDSYEAIEAVDRYLDQAKAAGWDEVRIIHGKGTGVLRQKINQFLGKDKRVVSKRLGRWGEGDTGVTIVRLKEPEPSPDVSTD